jgi:hypothetical protein
VRKELEWWRERSSGGGCGVEGVREVMSGGRKGVGARYDVR